jgi:hypothetical protein
VVIIRQSEFQSEKERGVKEHCEGKGCHAPCLYSQVSQ